MVGWSFTLAEAERMAAHAYYDSTMTAAATKAQLSQLGAKKNAGRSKPGTTVYSINGGGEAMVEATAGGKMRVRLYAGKCPC